MEKSTHESIRDYCHDAESAIALMKRRLGAASQSASRHTWGALILLVLAFLVPGAASQVAFVLAGLCGLLGIWALMDRTMLEGLIHYAELQDLFRPLTTGEDWLAYHLSERVLEEQRTQALEDALAAAEAAVAADETSRVHH